MKSLASKAGLELSEAAVEDFRALLGSLDDSIQSVLAQEDFLPPVDPAKYSRSDVSIPKGAAESEKGGYATRCTVKSVAPTSTLLDKKTVAIKDNIALAGVRCLNGMDPLGKEWVPEFDASVVTRILDAGGVITGKSACENACMEPSSDTSFTGIVHNPYADNYACGGSSSGSGRLVGSGAVDMALGCDQGGLVEALTYPCTCCTGP